MANRLSFWICLGISSGLIASGCATLPDEMDGRYRVSGKFSYPWPNGCGVSSKYRAEIPLGYPANRKKIAIVEGTQNQRGDTKVKVITSDASSHFDVWLKPGKYCFVPVNRVGRRLCYNPVRVASKPKDNAEIWLETKNKRCPDHAPSR